MLKNYKKIFIIGLIGYVLVNLIPVDRTNPPIKNEPDMPQRVKDILKNSCYDCHSNEVNYPIYSYLAPASWIIAGDVYNGRRHLNFSEWDLNNEKKLKEEIWEEIEKGDMPLAIYTFMHPNSTLEPGEKNSLEIWTKYEAEFLFDNIETKKENKKEPNNKYKE